MNRYPDPYTIVDNLKKPSRPGCCDPYEPQDYICTTFKDTRKNYYLKYFFG